MRNRKIWTRGFLAWTNDKVKLLLKLSVPNTTPTGLQKSPFLPVQTTQPGSFQTKTETATFPKVSQKKGYVYLNPISSVEVATEELVGGFCYLRTEPKQENCQIILWHLLRQSDNNKICFIKKKGNVFVSGRCESSPLKF